MITPMRPSLCFRLFTLCAFPSLALGCIIAREDLRGGDPDVGIVDLDVGVEGVDAYRRPDADRDAFVPPNVDANVCGDGVQSGSEMCDDMNTTPGDGCSATCTPEEGFNCAGSLCVPICGDRFTRGDETCDDGNASPNDGCDATCRIETGFNCTGAPSVCAPTCGDGRVLAGEACDDGNSALQDGCTPMCATEPGFVCMGAPSMCRSVCGDGIVAGTEACDDARPAESGDGCSAACAIESGYVCLGRPSVCTLSLCGNGTTDSGEGCDDGANGAGDGCSPTCQIEPGASCVGGMLNPQCSFPIRSGVISVGIPDEGAIMQAVTGTLPATCVPNRVRYVTLDLEHPYMSDLIATITNPAGASVELFHRPRYGLTGEGRDLNGAYRFFSNTTEPPFPGASMASTVPPGDYVTVNAANAATTVLRTFAGASGTFMVRIEDAGNDDFGTLRGVEVGIYCTPNR